MRQATDPVFADPMEEHVAVARVLFASGELYVTDLVMVGILNRSFDLTTAMKTLLDADNLTCAIPLLRLQIDNLLRLTYLATLPNADECSMRIIEGKHMRNMKDADGRSLTDARLRDYARPHYPWIDRAYDQASALVHFSDTHVFRSARLGEGERQIDLRVGIVAWPDNVRSEVEELFGYVTRQVLSIVERWGHDKRRAVDARTVHTSVQTTDVETAE